MEQNAKRKLRNAAARALSSTCRRVAGLECVRRGARALNVAPSAVSRAIKDVEETLSPRTLPRGLGGTSHGASWSAYMRARFFAASVRRGGLAQRVLAGCAEVT